MIESIKKLCQLEGMLRQISWFGSSDALADNIRGLGRRQPKLPDIVASRAGEIVSKMLRRDAASRVPAERSGIKSAFPENIRSAHDRVLRVRPRVTLETQRLFEIESNHRRFGELQHEVTQCADSHLRGNAGPLRLAQLRMSPIHFFAGRGDQSVQQIIRLHPKPLSPGDLDPRPPLIFFAQGVAKFSRAARSKCHHLVRKMRITIGRFVVAQSAQSFDHRVLSLGLPGIDDVINLGYIAKVWMIFFAMSGRNPAIMRIRIAKEFPIAKIAPQQPELPHVISDIFPNVANRAIRANNNFLVFLFYRGFYLGVLRIVRG